MNPYRASVCLLTLLLLGCSGSDESGPTLPVVQTPPEVTGPTGEIRARVSLVGEAPTPSTDPITENQETCGDAALLPRLVVGEGNGVQHAFVYLEDSESFPDSVAGEPVLIDQQECEYVPHAVAVRVGTDLEIINSDPILHNVHGTETSGEGRARTVFNVAQPVQGFRTTVEDALAEPGLVHLTCQAGHPWMSAWVLVTDHSYAGVTNAVGELLIPNVPVGTYTIHMWHEGVHLTRIVRSLQRYDYEEPYEVSQEVVVREGTETIVEFELVLRAAPD